MQKMTIRWSFTRYVCDQLQSTEIKMDDIVIRQQADDHIHLEDPWIIIPRNDIPAVIERRQELINDYYGSDD